MRTGDNLATNNLCLLLTLFFNNDFPIFKLTKTNQSLLAFQPPLIENNDVTYLLLQFRCQFFMKFGLLLPNNIELIQIILPIKYHIS